MAFSVKLDLDDIRKEMCKYKLTTLQSACGAELAGLSRFRSGLQNTLNTPHFINLLNFLYYDCKTEKGT